MTNSQRLIAVREYLRTWFLDRNEEAEWEVTESIMIRDGFYCGRNFRFATHRAVWFVEEEQVKIYGPDGALLETFSSADIPQPATTLKFQPAPSDSTPVRRAA